MYGVVVLQSVHYFYQNTTKENEQLYITFRVINAILLYIYIMSSLKFVRFFLSSL